MSSEVLVIGGGAAGMFAAVTAAREGAQVTLLERGNRLGRKLSITGKGRCNVCNDVSPREVIQNIPRNGKFLSSALYAFPPESVKSFFEQQGVPLKTERGNRVFPESDQAGDIVGALKTALYRSNVRIVTGRASKLLVENGAVHGVLLEDGSRLPFSKVILATGGLSYPLTGSTGDGYAMAISAGHTVTPCEGSLVPLEERGGWCRRMQGLSLRNVGLRLLADGKTVYEDFGELLFTHFGLSGPTILSASAHMREKASYQVQIDLKPALDEAALDARVLRDFSSQQNRILLHAVSGLYPSAMIPVIIEKSGLDPEKRIHDLTRNERLALEKETKAFTIDILSKRPVEEAIITTGGVEPREIDPRSMESRLCSGLYFAGEIIDADAYTGGFNLQIAWSTAYLAGRAAAKGE